MPSCRSTRSPGPGWRPRAARASSWSPRPSATPRRLRREAQIEAREESVRLRADVEQEVAERRSEILKIEERVLAKEEDIDRKLTELGAP